MSEAEGSRDLGHLFRRESGRMIAALTRVFGLHNLALAEDVVQDALCRALEVWKFDGVPENPSAWLARAAKNRAIDILRADKRSREFAPDVAHLFETEWALVPTVSSLFEEHELRDDQLRMMFSCCHPQIAETGQVVLILNVLCGFSVGEIAAAYLSEPAPVEKRLQRAKKTLASSGQLFEVSGAERIAARIDAVERALYLLFSEGYHGAHPRAVVRSELCAEAIRLTELLVSHPACERPRTIALLALMYLDAARLPARLDESGDLTTLDEQDRERWDRSSIARGLALLDRSASGGELTEYHVEAAIAATHAAARSFAETDWAAIVSLYDALYQLRPSPVVALNRAIAIGELHGPEKGIDELVALADRERLEGYPFYEAALGVLSLRAGRQAEGARHLERARSLARNPAEARLWERKLSMATGGRNGEDDVVEG